MRLPLHVSVHIYDHLQGAREQYFMQLLSWIPLMYVRCVYVQYAAVCHYRRFVCVSGAAVRVRSGQSIYFQISLGQQLQTHIQTDGNDIQPHTVHIHNERTSTEFNLVTLILIPSRKKEKGNNFEQILSFYTLCINVWIFCTWQHF